MEQNMSLTTWLFHHINKKKCLYHQFLWYLMSRNRWTWGNSRREKLTPAKDFWMFSLARAMSCRMELAPTSWEEKTIHLITFLSALIQKEACWYLWRAVHSLIEAPFRLIVARFVKPDLLLSQKVHWRHGSTADKAGKERGKCEQEVQEAREERK